MADVDYGTPGTPGSPAPPPVRVVPGATAAKRRRTDADDDALEMLHIPRFPRRHSRESGVLNEKDMAQRIPKEAIAEDVSLLERVLEEAYKLNATHREPPRDYPFDPTQISPYPTLRIVDHSKEPAHGYYMIYMAFSNLSIFSLAQLMQISAVMWSRVPPECVKTWSINTREAIPTVGLMIRVYSFRHKEPPKGSIAPVSLPPELDVLQLLPDPVAPVTIPSPGVSLIGALKSLWSGGS